jgi:HD superfamily phosphodiesterase
MKNEYCAIYLQAREYWNTRFNDIHVPIAYEQARKLLAAHQDADPDVVLPAVLLHDVGWKSIPDDQQLRAFGVVTQDQALQRFHETEGARIGGAILSAAGCDPRRRELILRIIDGHDSRLHALSLEDALVKDADKLWRFTATAADIDARRFKLPLREWVAVLDQRLDQWFFTPTAKRMAHTALAELQSGLNDPRDF